MAKGDLEAKVISMYDQLWETAIDVWLPVLDEIDQKGFDPSNENHVKVVQFCMLTVSGECKRRLALRKKAESEDDKG